MIDLSPKTKKLLNYLGVGLLVVVVVGLIGWVAVINPFLVREEKAQYDAANVELKQLSDEIQAKIGKASEVKSDDSCGRANLKNAEGPLGCTTGWIVNYNITGPGQANNLLGQAASIDKVPLREGPLTDRTSFVESTKKTVQIVYQNISIVENLSCNRSYEYYPANSVVKKNDSPQLDIILHCSGPAKAEHYPIRN